MKDWCYEFAAKLTRDRSMARDRPSPYVKERRFFHRIAGTVSATWSDL